MFNLRDNKLEQTLFKSKKMHVSEIIASNKINLVTITQVDANPTASKFSVYYLMITKQFETDLYASLKNNSLKKDDLKLNEELNLPFLLKIIARDTIIKDKSAALNSHLKNTPNQI